MTIYKTARRLAKPETLLHAGWLLDLSTGANDLSACLSTLIGQSVDTRIKSDVYSAVYYKHDKQAWSWFCSLAGSPRPCVIRRICYRLTKKHQLDVVLDCEIGGRMYLVTLVHESSDKPIQVKTNAAEGRLGPWIDVSPMTVFATATYV